jgi:hypothetical protein
MIPEQDCTASYCAGTHIWRDSSKCRQHKGRSFIVCRNLVSTCGALNQDVTDCCILLLDKAGSFSVVQARDGKEKVKVESIEAITVRHGLLVQ